MVLTDNLGGRLHSLSSQYAGFRDFDEPVRVVTPMSACPPDNGETSITPFRSTEQQQVDTSRNETLWPGREQVLGEEGRVEIAPFRSLSLGSYAWASYPQFEDIDTDIAGSGSGTRAVLEIDPATDLRGKVINPYGAMIILQTKYETTLKSLGLFDSEDEDKLVEDTDILFSRWGFHNGQPSCAPTGLVNTIEKSRETSNVLGSNPGNKQQGRRWRILSANARKLPGTFTGKGQCMPWSWRQIRSWGRRRKRYDSVLGSADDDESTKVSPPQRSYTDGDSVVVCDTLSFTDLRQRKRFHRPCFSWGGCKDGPSVEDETYLLNSAENSDGKKFD